MTKRNRIIPEGYEILSKPLVSNIYDLHLFIFYLPPEAARLKDRGYQGSRAVITAKYFVVG